jgi:uncharacterized protein (TIGR02145 family)
MRKLLLTTAAVAAAIGVAGCESGNTNTITDSRDGKTYKTIIIGGKTWMAQNLNYEIPDSSWCYKNKESYCRKYGRLYTWNAAMTACPAGYHLSSNQDWNSLMNTVGGKKEMRNIDVFWRGAGKTLKTKSGWKWNGLWNKSAGTDDYGFSALPGGYRFYGGDFYHAGEVAQWWTATDIFGDHAYVQYMTYVHDDVGEDDDYAYYKDYGYSVRCVAD